jgi:hypothetical protein
LTLLGNSDGNNVVFGAIDGFQNRIGGEERDLMLAAPATEQDADSDLLHTPQPF